MTQSPEKVPKFVLGLFSRYRRPMLAMDATPKDAARFEYTHLEVSHCRLTSWVPIPWLPQRPMREMRFRCKRCGASLSAEEAEAKWARQVDAPGYVTHGHKAPRFEG